MNDDANIIKLTRQTQSFKIKVLDIVNEKPGIWTRWATVNLTKGHDILSIQPKPPWTWKTILSVLNRKCLVFQTKRLATCAEFTTL